MRLAKALSVVSFFGTLAVGLAAAWIISGSPLYSGMNMVPAVVEPIGTSDNHCRRTVNIEPVRVEDMRGLWAGEWGYDGSPSTIEINRVSGDKFYGTLEKEGPQIAIEGWIDGAQRRITIQETSVIKLGPDMSMWSLGKNQGNFSYDGQTLTGTGKDQWGTYGWKMMRIVRD